MSRYALFATRISIGPARLAPADWKGFSSEADAQLAKIKQTHVALIRSVRLSRRARQLMLKRLVELVAMTRLVDLVRAAEELVGFRRVKGHCIPSYFRLPSSADLVLR